MCYFLGEGNFAVTELGVKVQEADLHENLTKEGSRNHIT